MPKKKSDRKTIIIVCLVFLLLALLWGFAVPHYTCEKDKNRCDFKFWGKYYSKDDCEKKCKVSPTQAPAGLDAPAPQKRSHCYNVSVGDHSYKGCTPCKESNDHSTGVQQFIDSNGQVNHQVCDKDNSYDSNEHCTFCLTNSSDSKCSASQLNSCAAAIPYQHLDYITGMQPLYYTNDYCNNCSYSNCTTCTIPFCSGCSPPPPPPHPQPPGPTTPPSPPSPTPGPTTPPSPPSPPPEPTTPSPPSPPASPTLGPLILKTPMTIPKLPEFPEFPKGAFTKGPVKPSTILKKPKILKSKPRIHQVPQPRIQKQVPQPRIQPQRQSQQRPRIKQQPRKIQRKVPRSIKERYVCANPPCCDSLQECVAHLCNGLTPPEYAACLNKCEKCHPPTSANTPWPNGVTMPFGKCINNTYASPATLCESECCGAATSGAPNMCGLCP